MRAVKRNSRLIFTTKNYRCFILGFVTHEWWMGVRYNFPTDSWEFNLFGLMLVVRQ